MKKNATQNKLNYKVLLLNFRLTGKHENYNPINVWREKKHFNSFDRKSNEMAIEIERMNWHCRIFRHCRDNHHHQKTNFQMTTY